MANAHYNFAYEQLCDAVEQLVATDEPVSVRLSRAAERGLKLRRKHLPAEAWPRLHLLLNSLTHGVTTTDERALAASLSQLSDEEARRCIKEFVAVFNMVSSQHYTN